MNDIVGHYSSLQSYTGPRITWANEMNSGMNHIQVQDRSLDLLTCNQVLCYSYP